VNDAIGANMPPDDGLTKPHGPSCDSFHRKFAYLNVGETDPDSLVRCPSCGKVC
jgi:hypothetical protein